MLMLARTSLLRILPTDKAIIFLGSNAAAVSSNTISMSLSSFGLLEGDMIIAWLATNTPQLPTSPGYTAITAGGSRAGVYFKTVGSTPDSSLAWSPIPSSIGAVGGALGFRNAVPATQGSPGVVEATGSSANPDPPGIAPNFDGSAIVIVAGTDGLQGGPVAPTNYTLAGNTTSNLSNDASGFAAYRLGLAKDVTENPGAFTNVSTSSWRAVTVAIAPAT